MPPLIDVDTLAGRLHDPTLRVVDARFALADPEAGRRAYEGAHLPGAVYLHLDDDLSGPLRADRVGGRHPLPDPDAFAARLGAAGIGDAHEVVAYDDAGGAFAARVWWLLHWIGRGSVRVLDGGIPAWRAAGHPLTAEVPTHAAAPSTATANPALVASRAEVRAAIADPGTWIVDARAPERYRGDVEPIDPLAGHVPGAVNRPFAENLRDDGRFRSADDLAARFAPLAEAGNAIAYCGSGVTGAHDVLAAVVAGFAMPRLYAGSWSDWTAQPDPPVATGSEGADDVAPA
jgi:thiosulfate/3-mercaptopyruvate sulfurtransferase